MVEKPNISYRSYIIMPLFRKKKKKKMPPIIPRDVFLRSKLVRNPNVQWEKKENGSVLLRIKLPKQKPGLFSGFVKQPEEKKIQLDEIGGYVWELADGTRTVDEVINLLAEKYKLHRREIEESFMIYLKTLMRRRLAGLLLPPDFVEKMKKQKEKEKDE
ncbi:MAG: hypothetical protein B6U94_01670 [Thermofilum sp. ex4484_79]|nr:MAG: hypothetical protein B6U94_01670 [Thermofilum sp. ex4484_79]